MEISLETAELRSSANSDISAVSLSQNPGQKKKVTVGDSVAIELELDAVKRNQNNHGAWTNAMIECLCDPGIVLEIDDEEDALVLYPSGNQWCINPISLTITKSNWSAESSNNFVPNHMTQASLFQPGDIVKILPHLELLKALQDGRGGWSESMVRAVGKSGIVQHVDYRGPTEVLVDNAKWTFNPVCLAKVSNKGPDCDTVLRQTEAQFLRYLPLLRAESETVAVAGGDSELPRSTASVIAIQSRTNAAKLDITQSGTKVKVELPLEEFKQIHLQQGIWYDDMTECLHNMGTIVGTDAEGNAVVRYLSGHRWVLNPKSVTLAANGELEGSPIRIFQANSNIIDDVQQDSSAVALLYRDANFTNGTFVAVKLDFERVAELQKLHGEWCDSMIECMCTVGMVVDVCENRDVFVFYASGNRYRLNSTGLTAVECNSADSLKHFANQTSPFEVGESVKVTGEQLMLKVLQRGRGEWQEPVIATLSEVGNVSHVHKNGAVSVNFSGKNTWTFNPLNLRKNDISEAAAAINEILEKSADLIRPYLSLFDSAETQPDDEPVAESGLDPGEQQMMAIAMDLFADLKEITQAQKQQLQQQPRVVAMDIRRQGERVFVNHPLQDFMQFQLQCGQWNGEMSECLQHVGLVRGTNVPGDFFVEYPSGNVWLLNRAALTFNPDVNVGSTGVGFVFAKRRCVRLLLLHLLQGVPK